MAERCFKPRQKILGRRYGRLTALRYDGFYRIGKRRWAMVLCRCDCGKRRRVRANSLSSGNTTSCGCYKAELDSQVWSTDYVERQLYYHYRINAVKRDRAFELSYERFYKMIHSPCFYCGSPPSTYRAIKKKRHTHELWFNGIDRKDNDRGYTVTNSVTCCKICNHAKHVESYQDFMAWRERMIAYGKKKPRL